MARTASRRLRPSMTPSIHPEKLAETRISEFAIRFFFGGVVSVAAALIGMAAGTAIGGIFTGFPAILLASLTLIARHEDREHASSDAAGAAVGAVGFVACAILLWRTLTGVSAVGSFLAALVVWSAVSVVLYALASTFFRPFRQKE